MQGKGTTFTICKAGGLTIGQLAFGFPRLYQEMWEKVFVDVEIIFLSPSRNTLPGR